MIIDTNGFEIGDEVWIINYGKSRTSPTSFIINAFMVTKLGIMAKEVFREGGKEMWLNNLYHTKQECKIECDRLNNIR